MALETEKLELDEGICKKGVAAVFTDISFGQYYVCEQKNQVIGSLLITQEWSDWRNGSVWWIQSVYVSPQFRGQGIFSKFYSHIKNLVEINPEVRGLRLYVDHTNKSAQAAYVKLGMNGEHYQMFEWMKTF